MGIKRKILRQKAKKQCKGFNFEVEDKEKVSFKYFWKYIFKK